VDGRERERDNKGPYCRFHLLSVTQSIDYHHRFSFQSVLAKTVEELDMLQGLNSTNLSKRLPSYLVGLQESCRRDQRMFSKTGAGWDVDSFAIEPIINSSLVQTIELSLVSIFAYDTSHDSAHQFPTRRRMESPRHAKLTGTRDAARYFMSIQGIFLNKKIDMRTHKQRHLHNP
jgi:hypothetical protein